MNDQPDILMVTTRRPYWRREVLTVAIALTLVFVVPPALWGSLQGWREIILAAGYTFGAAICTGFLLRPEHN